MARWDDEGYNPEEDDFTDAFGAGEYILKGRYGYVFHVSCWLLLEQVFRPAPVPCARLFEVCQSLPMPGAFFSWGHENGGVVYLKTLVPFSGLLMNNSLILMRIWNLLPLTMSRLLLTKNPNRLRLT